MDGGSWGRKESDMTEVLIQTHTENLLFTVNLKKPPKTH